MLDDKLAGHDKHCPKCDAHLTSLYLCPECGVRYDEWYKAEQRIAELETSKKRVIDQLHAHDLSHEIAIKEKDKRIAELEAAAREREIRS